MMRRRLWSLLFLAVVVGVAYWSLRHHLTIDFLIEQENRLRRWVADYPVTAVLIGFILYVLTSLIPGTAGKSVVYGWLFGFWIGLIVMNVALTIAAVIVFLAIRHLFFDLVHAKFGNVVRRVDAALCRDGATYLLTLRVLNVPYTLINYTAGATAVPTRTFWWTTQVGMLPGNIAMALAGSQLPTLRQVAERGWWSLVNLPLLIGLSLVALLPVVARRMIRRWRLSVDAESLTEDATSVTTTDRGRSP